MIWTTPIVPPPRPVLGLIHVTGEPVVDVVPEPAWLFQNRPLFCPAPEPELLQAGMTTATSSAARRPVHIAQILALPLAIGLAPSIRVTDSNIPWTELPNFLLQGGVIIGPPRRAPPASSGGRRSRRNGPPRPGRAQASRSRPAPARRP